MTSLPPLFQEKQTYQHYKQLNYIILNLKIHVKINHNDKSSTIVTNLPLIGDRPSTY